MIAIRRLLSRPIGKILAVPVVLLTLLVTAVIAITLDDLVRGGDCKSAIYDKSAKVFDSIVICGTSDVPQDKVDFAAAVAAQWLDNDQDGKQRRDCQAERLKAMSLSIDETKLLDEELHTVACCGAHTMSTAVCSLGRM